MSAFLSALVTCVAITLPKRKCGLAGRYHFHRFEFSGAKSCRKGLLAPAEQGATASLLLLYTGRPEFRAPWPQREHHLQLTLGRLSSRDVRTIVGTVAADHALDDETVATLVERTGGVPLFVEELTRAVSARKHRPML